MVRRTRFVISFTHFNNYYIFSLLHVNLFVKQMLDFLTRFLTVKISMFKAIVPSLKSSLR